MSIDEFLEVVGKECGLHLAQDDLQTDFDQLAGWDSLHLLKLLSALEAATGRIFTATRFLEARSLADLHAQVGATEWR
jgi:acyl carrier protein